MMKCARTYFGDERMEVNGVDVELGRIGRWEMGEVIMSKCGLRMRCVQGIGPNDWESSMMQWILLS